MMSIQLDLKDIIAEMETQIDEAGSLLNLTTRGIVMVTSEDLEAEDEIPIDIEEKVNNYI